VAEVKAVAEQVRVGVGEENVGERRPRYDFVHDAVQEVHQRFDAPYKNAMTKK
jgi:hypothetical protein